MKKIMENFLDNHSQKIAVLEIVAMIVMTFSFIFLGQQIIEIHNERRDAWQECDFDPSDEPGEPFYKENRSSSFPSSSSMMGRVSKPVKSLSVSSSWFSSTVIPLNTASSEGVL